MRTWQRGFLMMALGILLGCNGNKRYHSKFVDVSREQDLPDLIREVLDFQRELNTEYRDPETSPLPDRYRKDFESLDFFAPDTNYRVVAFLERTPEAVPFLMTTTTDRTSEEVVYGIARFRLNGQSESVEIYRNRELMLEKKYRDYLFFPFLDKTNGDQTYAGGRYIDLAIPNTDSIVIDFNKAYNPYCAYNRKYSCPVVPKVNRLHSEVRAGVKAFKK